MRFTPEQLATALMNIAKEFQDRPLTPAERWLIDYEDACTFARWHARRTEDPPNPTDVR